MGSQRLRLSKSKASNSKENKNIASAGNRTRGPTMATLDFTTKPLMLLNTRVVLHNENPYSFKCRRDIAELVFDRSLTFLGQTNCWKGMK
jgi:hypothetical protein